MAANVEFSTPFKLPWPPPKRDHLR